MDNSAEFDRTKAESDLHDVMFSLGVGAWAATSEVEGVAVYVCNDRVDTEVIARHLEKRGWKIEDVSIRDWIMEDGTDDEVVAVAFDVPGLPDEWRTVVTPAP